VGPKGWRKMLYGLAAAAALLASGPMLPLELAVWFSGELLLYLEVVSGVWLTSRMASWKSLNLIVRAKAARLWQYIKADWTRSHPSLATWIQWTFAGT
jgi:hypothetical protein